LPTHTSDRATASILTAARQSGLTAYDAAYLELALREAIPIATRDKAVLNACKKAGIKAFKASVPGCRDYPHPRSHERVEPRVTYRPAANLHGVRAMSPLVETGLWPAQIKAIKIVA
jgi:hypothetical protein